MAGIAELLRTCAEFRTVCSMMEYLREVQKKTGGSFNAMPVDEEFEDFLNTTLVVLGVDYAFPTSFSPEVKCIHSQLVDGVVSSQIFMGQHTENGLRLDVPVQTLGYSYYQTGKLRKTPSLTLSIKTVVWQQLHEFVGSDLTSHMVGGKDFYVLSHQASGYIQVIGDNLATLVLEKLTPLKFKREATTSFKDYQANKKSYADLLAAKQSKKPDILSKLPKVNRTRMLYNALIRKNTWLSKKHCLHQPLEVAVPTIIGTIVNKGGPKYRALLTPFVTKILKNFKRIDIGALLNRHCPFPKGWMKDFESNLKQDFSFEWIFAQSIPVNSVAGFLVNFMHKLLPPKMFGCRKNERVFQKSLVHFLKMGTWESISAAALCTGYSFSKIPWLKGNTSSDSEQRLAFGKLMLWLYNEVVVPILQNTLYITEKQHNNLELFYYRKPVWAVVLNKSRKQLESARFFDHISKGEAESCRDFTQFPHAKLRVQPKLTDFRPIMHFKSKIEVKANLRLDGNSLLAGMPQIIQAKLKQASEVLVLDYPTLVERISAFAKEVEAKGSPQLFFVTMDIAKAFDCVKLSTLRKLLDELKLPTLASYYKYISLTSRFARPKFGPISKVFRFKFRKQAVDESQFPLFTDLVDTTSASAINILTAKTTFKPKDKVTLIERILQCNVIKFNRQSYRSLKGVPQGLSCSPLLSNLYYGSVETRVLKAVRQAFPDALLFVIRLHDDYLCLSDSQEAVESFLQEMHNVADEENFGFGKDKIVGNFESPLISKVEGSVNGWVGLDLTPTLQVVPHVNEEASKTAAFDFISGKLSTVDIKKKLVKIVNVALNLIRYRSNAEEALVATTMAKLMKLASCRFVSFLKTVSKFYRQPHHPKIISKLIVRVLKYSSLNFGRINPSVFMQISLKEFVEAFLGSSLHPVGKMLNAYLTKLPL